MSNRTLAAAKAIRIARQTRTTIPKISETFGVKELDEAYAVAALNTESLQKSGKKVIGYKVGLTSKVVQEQLGVDQPDFGVLFDDMEFLSGQQIDSRLLIQPKAEAEVAFVLGQDIGPGQVSYGQFLNALRFAVPAIEVVDSVIDNWSLTISDTVADNASCGLYVLGNQPHCFDSVMLAELKMTMSKNSEVVSRGVGSACLGHPLRAAYWLVQTMLKRGQPMYSGQIILSGAVGQMVSIEKGDKISVTMDTLGSVSFDFV